MKTIPRKQFIISRRSGASRAEKAYWQKGDELLDYIVPRGHRFTFFRVGVDECAKCKKTAKEHKSS